jgi:hypothetical protein
MVHNRADGLLAATAAIPQHYLHGTEHNTVILKPAQTAECCWQEGASFVPAAHSPAPCWERRLLYGFSDRILQVHRYGDDAIFEALELVWARVFRRQYAFYLRLAH